MGLNPALGFNQYSPIIRQNKRCWFTFAITCSSDGRRGRCDCVVCGICIGPTSRTVGEFWAMIWQENVRCIVMATSLYQHAKVHGHTGTYTRPTQPLTHCGTVDRSISNLPQRVSRMCKKVKVAHTRLPSVRFRSRSRFLAVSLQVT